MWLEQMAIEGANAANPALLENAIAVCAYVYAHASTGLPARNHAAGRIYVGGPA